MSPATRPPASSSLGKGSRWNESRVCRDPLTGRRIRHITTAGLYNQTPNYHTATGFTADGRWLVFATGRGEASAMGKANTETGEITLLTDWFPGLGCLDELHKNDGRCIGNGLGVTMLAGVAPESGWLVFVQGRALRAVHLESLEERVLWSDFGPGWICGMPSVNPEEDHVLLPLMPIHPELADDACRTPRHSYLDHHGAGGTVEVRLVKVPLAGGAPAVVYAEKGIGCAHCPHSPVDGNLVLLDRDHPPRLWCGGDHGQTTRVWVLSLRDGRLTEVRPRNAQRFQVHAAWSWDGRAVLYHGEAAEGGTYIGAARPDGSIIHEYLFPEATHYGHVSAMAGQPGIILDGNLTSDGLTLLRYDAPEPRIEPITRHGSDLRALPWQYAHPHPQSDPQGRRISWNAAADGRSDIFLGDYRPSE